MVRGHRDLVKNRRFLKSRLMRSRAALPAGGTHHRLILLPNTMAKAIESLIYTRGRRTVTQL